MPRVVGILGGSFNPAHGGHWHIAQTALARLRLDQVWFLVSPGNPLKSQAGMAPMAARLASAAGLADGKRVLASGIEAKLGTRYTVDTVRLLRQRFPHVRFIWLMGADNLRQFAQWRDFMGIARAMPVAVLPRPGYNYAALASLAAKRLRHCRMRADQAHALAAMAPPAWVFLMARQDARSATALRALGKSA
jgi:nicotinate-nucleotide adenylyltransferase